MQFCACVFEKERGGQHLFEQRQKVKRPISNIVTVPLMLEDRKDSLIIKGEERNTHTHTHMVAERGD